MSFVNERAVRSVRKAGLCDCCSQIVAVGEAGVRWAGISEGEFLTALYHPECRVAEIALNKLHNTHYDEWLSLDHLEPEDESWLLEKHPAVAARKGVTAASIAHREEGWG